MMIMRVIKIIITIIIMNKILIAININYKMRKIIKIIMKFINHKYKIIKRVKINSHKMIKTCLNLNNLILKMSQSCLFKNISK